MTFESATDRPNDTHIELVNSQDACLSFCPLLGSIIYAKLRFRQLLKKTTFLGIVYRFQILSNYVGSIERPLLAVSVAFALLKLSLECKL